ncbi:MAG: hypothetical protein LBS83_00005 [Holosporales bacterium]|nr:hypothetical protein [Holosporales bacterium]
MGFGYSSIIFSGGAFSFDKLYLFAVEPSDSSSSNSAESLENSDCVFPPLGIMRSVFPLKP